MANYTLEGAKWGNPTFGTYGGTVTWAVDGTVPAIFINYLIAAFADWAKYTNIQFQEVASTATSNIDISLASIDGLDQILAQTQYWYSGTSFVSATITFDSGEGWHSSSSNVISNDNVNLYPVALHEIGHAIGLGHYNSVPAIMNAYYNASVTDLLQPDIDGIEAIYGNAVAPSYSFSVTVTAPAGRMGPEWHLLASADYTGDGNADLTWMDTAGNIALWTMKSGALAAAQITQGHMGTEWTAFSTNADFNKDGKADLLWTSNGSAAIWEMNGASLAGFASPGGHMGPEWQLKGVGDLNGDGNSDLVWVSSSNQVALWSMNGAALANAELSDGQDGSEWTFSGVGNFDSNGKADLLWVSSSGAVQVWSMSGSHVIGASTVGQAPTGSHIAGIADVTKDGVDDIVWIDASNNVKIWQMKNDSVAEVLTPSGHMGTEWQLSSIGDVTGDGRPDLVWTSGGATAVWNLGAISSVAAAVTADNFQFDPAKLASLASQSTFDAAGPHIAMSSDIDPYYAAPTPEIGQTGLHDALDFTSAFLNSHAHDFLV
ncbi:MULTISPECIES: FG-GAP-like repeat-containing protein [unclassified Bradyrhizobium]|uniref:FG-GAP-like repeat-containing protein n=1 Tax=unclassified Bradyrhizobium TaxID=2631580 RepID=UPI002916C742|nr:MULTISPECIES: FG-GAP-like repeat-containing protein [unclassified Bradyrhizobium]